MTLKRRHKSRKDAHLRDQRYIDFLKTQRCVITGLLPTDRESVVPIHIGTAGKALKSPDWEALPVIDHLHQEGHRHGEISMLREHAPDWLLREAFRAYARELYQQWRERKD